MTNLYDELSWRGMVSESTEGLSDLLARESVTAYIGFDPTASSLHVGSLLTVMGLARLQRFGHHPIAIVGGGTGMIGDPSGKSQERKLLSREQLERERRRHQAAAGAFSRLRRRAQSRAHRQQRGLAGVVRSARIPSRHGQVLHRELHAAEGIGEPAARERGRHLVHGVQLSPAAGTRFPRALRSVRLHAADGRQRSVGQYHGRHRSDPAGCARRRRTGSSGR